jgi:hypothetical protein
VPTLRGPPALAQGCKERTGHRARARARRPRPSGRHRDRQPWRQSRSHCRWAHRYTDPRSHGRLTRPAASLELRAKDSPNSSVAVAGRSRHIGEAVVHQAGAPRPHMTPAPPVFLPRQKARFWVWMSCPPDQEIHFAAGRSREREQGHRGDAGLRRHDERQHSEAARHDRRSDVAPPRPHTTCEHRSALHGFGAALFLRSVTLPCACASRARRP